MSKVRETGLPASANAVRRQLVSHRALAACEHDGNRWTWGSRAVVQVTVPVRPRSAARGSWHWRFSETAGNATQLIVAGGGLSTAAMSSCGFSNAIGAPMIDATSWLAYARISMLLGCGRIAFTMLAPALLNAGILMYGVNGGHGDSTPPNGDLVIVDQTTGDATVLGASGFPRLSGIGIIGSTIYATTLGPGGFPPGPGFVTSSDLVKLALTGMVTSDVGTIHVGSLAGPALPVADLAVQPGTDALYAISNDKTAVGGPAAGGLYTINPVTAIATLLGQTTYPFGSIAFAPDGSLYIVGATTVAGPPINPVLARLNPLTGATIGSPVSLQDFYGAFGIRPTDSTFFVGNGDGSQIFTLNPSTGNVTALSSTTGSSFVGDLDFVAPEPGTFVLAGLGIAAAAFYRRRLFRQH